MTATIVVLITYWPENKGRDKVEAIGEEGVGVT